MKIIARAVFTENYPDRHFMIDTLKLNFAQYLGVGDKETIKIFKTPLTKLLEEYRLSFIEYNKGRKIVFDLIRS